MAPRMLFAALPVLALLAFPALAGAVTQMNVMDVPGVGKVVVVTDDGSSSTIEIENGITTPEPPPGNVRYVAVRNFAGVQESSAECDTSPDSTIAACEGVFARLDVNGQGGNDKITMDLIVNESPLNAIVFGGPGDDELKATPDGRQVPQPQTHMEGNEGNDTLVTGNGPDLLLGGEGNDTMEAHQGPDTVRGEGGNDSVSGGKEEPAPNAADVVDGGPGFDTIPNLVNDYDRLFDDDVSITLDNQANDGEPGEGDNVIAVEKLNMVANHATFVGTDAAEDVFVESNTSTVRGLGGNDRLVTYDGNDDIEGGDGDDFIQGGFGHDVLTGGAGVDQFQGDRQESNVFAVGSDRIFARDGNVEQISCGLGSDTAEVDTGDVVDATCESVDRGGQRFGPRTLVTIKLAASRIPGNGPLKVVIANANDFAVTGTVSGQTVRPITVSRRAIVKLKSKRFSVAAKGRRTVKLKLPAAMRRTLKRTGKLALRMTVKVKDPAGTTRTVKKKVTPKLKR